MITMLAANGFTDSMRNLFDTVVALFSRADTLAHPEHVVSSLQTLSAIWAVVFMIVGTLCLLNGYKFYKIATIALALLIGCFLGYYLGRQIEAPFIVAGCLGLLMAVCAWPLMKYTVAVFGGLTGAFVGANLWTGLADSINRISGAGLSTEAYWIGALVGLILFGMLAFVLFKLSIVLFTSVSGATIAMLGVLALLLSYQPWQQSIVDGVTANQLVVPMLVFVPAIIGLILQETWSSGTTITPE